MKKYRIVQVTPNLFEIEKRACFFFWRTRSFNECAYDPIYFASIKDARKKVEQLTAPKFKKIVIE